MFITLTFFCFFVNQYYQYLITNYNFVEKKRAYLIEFLQSSCMALSASHLAIKYLNGTLDIYDGYYANTLGVACLIVDFYYMYFDYKSFFKPIAIFHHIFYILVCLYSIYNYHTHITMLFCLVEIPNVYFILCKFYPKIRNDLFYIIKFFIFRIIIHVIYMYLTYDYFMIINNEFYLRCIYRGIFVTLLLHGYWTYRLIISYNKRNNSIKNV